MSRTRANPIRTVRSRLRIRRIGRQVARAKTSASVAPFKSRAQWRYFFASPRLRRYAHQKAHATQAARGGVKVAYRSLPNRKRAPSARTAR